MYYYKAGLRLFITIHRSKIRRLFFYRNSTDARRLPIRSKVKDIAFCNLLYSHLFFEIYKIKHRNFEDEKGVKDK